MDVVTEHEDRMIRIYDRLAPAYDLLHRRWLRFAGGEAQAALEAAVRMALSPRVALLDAGCGTGWFARNLIAEGVAPHQISLLDPSPAMLEICKDIPVRQRLGRLEKLPFADASFDVVTCAWALETVTEPQRAIHELSRVLRPDGVLCLAFCAQTLSRSLGDKVMQKVLALRRTGRFLRPCDIVSALNGAMPCDVRIMPCTGPVATIVARRWPASEKAASHAEAVLPETHNGA